MRSKRGIQPICLVINLKVMDAVQPDTGVAVFDRSIEVRVSCTASDLEKAAGKPFCLRFWDGKQWIHFTPGKQPFACPGY